MTAQVLAFSALAEKEELNHENKYQHTHAGTAPQDGRLLARRQPSFGRPDLSLRQSAAEAGADAVTVLNDLDRFHLVMDTIDRRPQTGEHSPEGLRSRLYGSL